MAQVEVLAVDRTAVEADLLRRWHLDLPEPALTCDGIFLRVAGWVVGEVPVASISVTQSGIPVSAAPVALERPDVTAALGLPAGAKTGFELMVSVVTLPSAFELTVWAEIVGEAPVQLATIRGSRTPVRSGYQPALQPISVTSLGRTGTTLVMSMLGAHPEVLVHDVFPYETRLASYWMHAYAVLSAPANPDVSSHPDRFLEDPYRIGHNPWAFDYPPNGDAFRRWMRDDSVGPLAAFCQQSIEGAYLRIAADQEKGSARFFAEKNIPTHVPRMLGQLYDGMREIVLVRDFRDVLCSMVAFDAKRGSADFRHDDADLPCFANRIIGDFRRLVESWQERRDTNILVRYEDLIAEPHACLTRIAEYAGIDASPDAVARMVAAGTAETNDVKSHRTAGTWSRTAGRFRRDLSDRMRRHCQEVGGDVLSALGYPADDAVAEGARESISARR